MRLEDGSASMLRTHSSVPSSTSSFQSKYMICLMMVMKVNDALHAVMGSRWQYLS